MVCFSTGCCLWSWCLCRVWWICVQASCWRYEQFGLLCYIKLEFLHILLLTNKLKFFSEALSRLDAVLRHPNATHSENVMAYDNAVSALGKICQFHRDSIDAAQVFETRLYAMFFFRVVIMLPCF